jgi:hypothetical protein
LPETGESCFFEFKWWSDVYRARWDAAKQVRSYLKRGGFEIEVGRKVTGAYFALLEWNLAPFARLTIERAN